MDGTNGCKCGSGIKGIKHRELLNFLDSEKNRKKMSKKQLQAAKETVEKIVEAKLEDMIQQKKEEK